MKKNGVTKTTARIDVPTYKALRGVWDKMLIGAKVQQEPGVCGLDGVTYDFYGYPDGSQVRKSGEVWSPEKDTPAGRLVEIARLLGTFAESKDRKVLPKIREKCAELADRIKE